MRRVCGSMCVRVCGLRSCVIDVNHVVILVSQFIAMPSLEDLGWASSTEHDGDGSGDFTATATARAISGRGKGLFPLRAGDHVVPVCHQGEVRSQVAFQAATSVLRAAHVLAATSTAEGHPEDAVINPDRVTGHADMPDSGLEERMGVAEVMLEAAQPSGPVVAPCADHVAPREGCGSCAAYQATVAHASSVWLPHGAEGGFDPYTAYKNVDWETYFGYLHGGATELNDHVRVHG